MESPIVFAQQKKTYIQSELPLIGNFCAQINEPAKWIQSAISIGKS